MGAPAPGRTLPKIDLPPHREWRIHVTQVDNGFVVRVHDSRTDTSATHVATAIGDAMDVATAAIVTSRMQG
jgi:hypothetical protein